MVAAARLLIASTNPGKIREIKGILAGVPVTLVTLDDYPELAEPEETGTTFAENARLKAVYYAERTGLVAAADDSGLEIEALGNLPGVESARWHGTHYPTKFEVIYRELAARRLTTSPARFVCCVAVARPGRAESDLTPGRLDAEVVFEARGTVEGQIAPEPQGRFGFGYDPIFFYPPYGCTLGEVDGERKAAVSHRGKAFRDLRQWLLIQPA